MTTQSIALATINLETQDRVASDLACVAVDMLSIRQLAEEVLLGDSALASAALAGIDAIATRCGRVLDACHRSLEGHGAVDDWPDYGPLPGASTGDKDAGAAGAPVPQ